MPRGKRSKKKDRFATDGKKSNAIVFIKYNFYIDNYDTFVEACANSLAPPDDSESVCSSLDDSVLSDDGEGSITVWFN